MEDGKNGTSSGGNTEWKPSVADMQLLHEKGGVSYAKILVWSRVFRGFDPDNSGLVELIDIVHLFEEYGEDIEDKEDIDDVHAFFAETSLTPPAETSPSSPSVVSAVRTGDGGKAGDDRKDKEEEEEVRTISFVDFVMAMENVAKDTKAIGESFNFAHSMFMTKEKQKKITSTELEDSLSLVHERMSETEIDVFLKKGATKKGFRNRMMEDMSAAGPNGRQRKKKKAAAKKSKKVKPKKVVTIDPKDPKYKKFFMMKKMHMPKVRFTSQTHTHVRAVYSQSTRTRTTHRVRYGIIA